MLKVRIQKISDDAIIPKYAHDTDAGMDIYSVKDYVLKPMHRMIIKTGLKIEIPKGYEMQIRPKSGLALKNGITLPNSPGTIDADYRGELGVILINLGSQPYKIEKGQKIAQAVFNKIEKARLIESKELNRTRRGEGGFGSTGLK